LPPPFETAIPARDIVGADVRSTARTGNHGSRLLVDEDDAGVGYPTPITSFVFVHEELHFLDVIDLALESLRTMG
jgi:hypothetical protein